MEFFYGVQKRAGRRKVQRNSTGGVDARFVAYADKNSLFTVFQSGYRTQHSTETALVTSIMINVKKLSSLKRLVRTTVAMSHN